MPAARTFADRPADLTPAGSRSATGGWLTRLLVGAALVCALIGTGAETAREFSASRLISASDEAGRGHAVTARLAFWEGACRWSCPARAMLADAAARVSIASRGPPSPYRDGLFQSARTSLAKVAAVEPLNGVAWTEMAYLDTMRGAKALIVLGDLQKSYALQPFQRQAGRWRLAAGGRLWPTLTPDLRRRVLDEAEWMWLIDPLLQDEVVRDFTTDEGQFALSSRLSRATPLRNNTQP